MPQTPIHLKTFVFIISSLLLFNCKNDKTSNELDPRLEEIHTFFAWHADSKDSLSKALLMLDEISESSDYKAFLYSLIFIHREEYSKALKILRNEEFLEENKSPYTLLIVGALTEIEEGKLAAIQWYKRAESSRVKFNNNEMENFRKDFITWLIEDDETSLKRLSEKYRDSDSYDIQAILDGILTLNREEFLNVFVKSST